MSQDKVNGQHESLKGQVEVWNSTIMTWSHDARDLWKNPKITMIWIELLVSLVAGILLLLACFGSRRRRSRNWFLQKGVLGAYTVSFSLATYTLGSMQSSEVKSSMYPVWALSLFMLHACTDSMTAYSLDDNIQVTRLNYQAFMYHTYVVLLFTTVHTKSNYIPELAYISFIAVTRYLQRLAVCHLAAYSWNLNKTVADYMYGQQNGRVFDPATMEGCNYLVDWPISESKFDASTSYGTQLTVGDHDEVITIEKIWVKSLGPELKDACLSFSLFHLLRRRFFGFACDESKGRTHEFIFKGLLTDGATDYNRVFKVIEVELAYMYDFFFTKYAVIYYGSPSATVWSVISIIGISITAYVTAKAPVNVYQGDSAIASTIIDDVVITLVILTSTALLEFVQLLYYWTGIWGRVSFACQSIREQARFSRTNSQTKKTRTRGGWVMGLKGLLANIGVSRASNNHYWQHKLGQYSLLDSVSCNPRPSADTLSLRTRTIMLVWRVCYLSNFMLNHRQNEQAFRARKRTWKSVELPDEVKKAVICSLKRTSGTLSNGKSSLRFNGAHDLLWACKWELHPDPSWSQRKQNQTHIILTWHIATWYCEMATLSEDRATKPDVCTVSIATKLSKYCAYLVVSVPKLLPGHHYDTRSKFDAAIVEAIKLPPESTSMYEAMKRLKLPQEPKTIFESGVKLGKQLEEMEEGARWQVMAGFWAEMLLYLAPSDNVNEHIEQLTQGGEFITHLWALLSHAGILERDEEHQAGEACDQHRVDSFVSTASCFCQCECV
ncbi:uncharacterized protein LOC125554436 [Triticum urartu]|uniref:uncharacterized protein LOC125554436 n=1 Tax=Triticum urartu TaxID=4572 RepID=UPI0020440FED|nr:uncharacterized protein LOC125554436 [Triticum urartu]